MAPTDDLMNPVTTAPPRDFKALYRKLDRGLGRIEQSEDVSKMLTSILESLVKDFREELGFESGRDRDKLDGVPHRLSEVLGCPILDDCWAWFECRVINVMDTGSSTCFLGDVVDLGRGPGKEIMTPGYMRANLPEAWREPYLTNLAAAQAWARERSPDIRAVIWKGLRP